MGCGCFFILVAVGAIVMSLSKPLWGWGILAIPNLFLTISLAALKMKRWKHIPELSPPANRMMQQYGHFYAMPFASREYSSAASGVQIAGWIMGLVSAYHGFWWGLPLALVNGILMAYVAKSINPSVFLTDPGDQLAHQEVIDYVTKRRSDRRTTTIEAGNPRTYQGDNPGGRHSCASCDLPKKYVGLLNFPVDEVEVVAAALAPVLTNADDLLHEVKSLRRHYGVLDLNMAQQIGILYCPHCHVSDIGTIRPASLPAEAAPNAFTDMVCDFEPTFTLAVLRNVL